MNVISSERLPIKMWLDHIEDGAMQQALNLANLPFAFEHIAIMPDAHQGYGMPIGGVLATKGVVIPNAVGVDIGCGVLACKTSIKDISNYTLKIIRDKIKEKIPVGFNHHIKPQENDFILPGQFGEIIKQEETHIDYQIGTLGGGNHFIEIQKGNDDSIWIMIHSGSRNFGKKVADYYNKLAVKMNQRWYSKVPKNQELAFLPIEDQLAKLYLVDMNICVDFALANRKLMLERIEDILIEEIGCYFQEPINIVHNYARFENHFGENVIVHRKGATSAKYGQIGIIPGSQGTKSYIVKGKGNPQSFNSCSHGAGRKMGRKEAERTLDLNEQLKILNDQNIIHDIKDEFDLDEAPGAYKDIHDVIKQQEDLVEVLIELTPLAVIKG